MRWPCVSPETETVYDALSRPVSEADANGNVTEYLYSDYGRTVEVRQPSPGGTLDRPVTITKYDANGNVLKVIDGKVAYNAASTTAATELRWTRYVYNDLNQVIEVWKTLPDATGAPSSMNEYLADQSTYDKNGNVLTSTQTITLDGSGDPDDVQTTTFVYDLLGRNTSRTEQDPDGTSPTSDQPVWTMVYDKESRMTSQTDPLSKTTDYGFDRLGQLRYTTLPDPDGAGPLGRPLYTNYYDNVGRVTKEKDPLNHYTLYVYDLLDNQTWDQAKDSSDNELTLTKYGYDAGDRLRNVAVKTGTYTQSGSTYNTYALTSYTYDNLGNVIRIYQPDPDDLSYVEGPRTYSDTSSSLPRPQTNYTYDANGNQLTEVNELGKTATKAYDDLNRLISRTDPDPDAGGSLASPVTSYSWDVFGNRTSLTDPDGNITSWTYDLWGQMLTEESPLSGVTQDREFEYDLLGNLTQRTDHLGQIISYSHDLLGRTINEQWTTLASGTVTTQIDYTYDKKSQLLTADEYVPGTPNTYISEYTYTYNNVGWQTSAQLEQAGLVTTTLNNTFDLNGRRTVQKADFTIGSVATHDFQNEYGYDGKNRLTSLKQTVQGSGGTYSVVADKYVTFGYNGQDQVIDVDRYANTSASNLVAHSDYDRDYLGRVTGIDHLKGSTHFATYDFTWDARSRITAIDSVFSNSAWNEDHDFTYDHTDQLTAADHTLQSDEAYAFDENGNRDGNQTHLGATNSSTVSDNNRISSDGVYNYTYDDEGSMLTKTRIATGGKEEYSWDHRRRLTLVTFKNSSNVVTKTVSYTYDHNNLLASRSLDADGAGSGTADTTTFMHDGNQIVLMFYKASPLGTLALVDRLLWSSEVDYLLSDERVTSLSSAGTVYWSLPDHLGTVVDVATYNSGTDTTTIAKHRGFDAFGNITSDSATGVIFVMGYTGKYLDADTGAQNNVHRWYAAWLGEWMTEDPIGFDGGTADLTAR